MAGEPLPARSRTDTHEPALRAAGEHLERLGYRVLEHHIDLRSGADLVIARCEEREELLFCDLVVETIHVPARLDEPLRRRRLRRAAFAWLGAEPGPRVGALRFDRLTVVLGRDSRPLGIEHHPNAF
jgi:Holliday junction resolvase-like predicted endonuclease